MSTNIHARLDEAGNLTLQGHDGISTYAIKQWEKQRIAGKAKLIINQEPYFDYVLEVANSSAEWKLILEELKKNKSIYQEFIAWRQEKSK